MDERLQRIERDGTPVAKLRARRQAGWSEEEAWRGLVTPELPYADALELAKQLEELRFLEVTRQTCGDFEGETGRFAHEATGLVFRLIPGGRFLMGSREGVGEANERPQREVRVRPFLLCETTCTQEAWDRLGGEGERGGEGLPVVMQSWEEMQAWCGRAGLRLPSEAEWEFACRAGSVTAYGHGDDEGRVGDYAWFHGNSDPRAHPVALKRPNAWGLYDMCGNVLEACEDTYATSYEGAPTDGSARVDADAPYRVFRGSSWSYSASHCRSAFRFGSSTGFRHASQSLRPARSLP